MTPQEIKKSKADALDKIRAYLGADDVDGQFSGISGGYYSNDKFIVVWNGYWKGILAEFSINKCDSFYTAYSGYKATYSTQGLLHEKQLGGYSSIERALIDVGMKLCPTKEEKVEFFNKYATKYNDRLKKQRESNENQ